MHEYPDRTRRPAPIWPVRHHALSRERSSVAGGVFGIDIHVPFCATRCGYCDFNTYTPGEPGGATPDGWLAAVLCDPVDKPDVGARPLKGHALLLRARRSDFRFPTDAPKATFLLCWHESVWRAVEISVAHEEILDADHESVIGRVCAVDVAKATGNVCVRVPHPTLDGRRVSRVWDVPH